MAELATQFKAGALDRAIVEDLAGTAREMTIQEIADRHFPRYSPQWCRERIRRMHLAGLLEIDTTTRPATVRLPRRHS